MEREYAEARASLGQTVVKQDVNEINSRLSALCSEFSDMVYTVRNRADALFGDRPVNLGSPDKEVEPSTALDYLSRLESIKINLRSEIARF